MKLQQLKYLLAIVDNGLNITAAADRLYTSQPGVSKQLKLLEEELGLELFKRKGKSLDHVTSAGEQVIKCARHIMAEVEQIRCVADDYYHDDGGVLSIAATNTQARYVLPEIVSELRRRYPKVNLNLHQGSAEQIADLVVRNDIDFVVASGSDELFGNMLRLPVHHWDRTVLVPNGHPLAKLDRQLTLSDVASYPLVSDVFDINDEASLKSAFGRENLEANFVFTAGDADVIKSYVRMGLGVGIVAGMSYESQDHDKLTAIPVDGIFPRRTTWLGFRKSIVLRCFMAEFIRLFAPHVDNQQIEQAMRAASQRDIDHLFRKAKLPVRNGSFPAQSAVYDEVVIPLAQTAINRS
jgi:LysR family cys regulon transcriptional activator